MNYHNFTDDALEIVYHAAQFTINLFRGKIAQGIANESEKQQFERSQAVFTIVEEILLEREQL